MSLRAVIILILMAAFDCWTKEVRWDQSLDLDENFRVFWQIRQPDIVFEVQVRTLGYVGFGFSRNGLIYGADMVIGWVDNKHTFFQDRHIPVHSHNGEPVIDESQDYVLLSGRENTTHTILRFRRKLDTCDDKFDVPILNDTMKIIFMYHMDEPRRGSLQQGSLPEPEHALKPIKSILILNRPKFNRLEMKNELTIETFDVTVNNIPVTQLKFTKACSVHHLMPNKIGQLIAFEPIFEPLIGRKFITQMTIHQCETFTIQPHGDICLSSKNQNCSILIASWSRGSQGFVYPDDVGFAIDSNIAKVFFLQIHYDAFASSHELIDNSGMKFKFTTNKRKHNAGLLEFGIRPDWTHVIPPGFRKVTSVGYCTGKVTKEAFESSSETIEGISIVGAQLQTHQMGQSSKVRVIRNGTEISPFLQDMNIDPNYSEFRSFDGTMKILPGDDLIVECSYNSYDKSKVTLGGFDSQQEMCQAILIYYPRQDHLTSCHSKPKTKHFLKSFNIDTLTPNFTIESPEKYAGRTLEEHLRTYDWKSEFNHFEQITKTSPFDIVFNNGRKNIGAEPVNIVKPYLPPPSYCDRYSEKYQNDHIEDNRLDNVQQARSKVLRSSESMFEFTSSSFRLKERNWLSLIIVVVVYVLY